MNFGNINISTTDTTITKRATREELLAHVEAVPTLPIIVTEILGTSTTSPEFLTRIREFARNDPGLAGRIIALANSAAYAPVTDILDINTAVVRLGSRILSEIVRAFTVLRVFVPSTPAHCALWSHAIQVATMARMIAIEGHAQVNPEVCYAVGLLHDVGRLVMFANDPARLREVDDEGWRSPAELVNVERAIFGIDHAELGAVVCERWGVPGDIVFVIRKHHEPDAWQYVSSETRDVLRIVQQADLWSVKLMLSQAGGPESMDGLARQFESSIIPESKAILGPKDFRDIISQTLVATGAQRRVLGLQLRVE
ncbi:MAG: HDOD domain-containing protein [Planctomycetes bacterium]|nr:HDOD domain-containing protein [Planctomycetota bacterium]